MHPKYAHYQENGIAYWRCDSCGKLIAEADLTLDPPKARNPYYAKWYHCQRCAEARAGTNPVTDTNIKRGLTDVQNA